MQANYRLVFDLADQPPWPNPILLVPLLLTGVGALLVFKPDLMKSLMPGGLQGAARRIFSWFYFLFAAAMTAVVLVSQGGEASRLRDAEKRHAAVTVEGCLQRFHRMPSSGHDTERIQVNGVPFQYSDFILTPAFHTTESHGGPIHADSRVRIARVGGDIVRLEVADHACLPAPDSPS